METFAPEIIQSFISSVPHAVLTRFLIDEKPPKCAEVIAVHACVLFADVSGFTRMAEVLSANGHHGVEQLTVHLNAYFDKMIQIILKYGGDVVRFAGDAMLLIWTDIDEYKDKIKNRHRPEEDPWTEYNFHKSSAAINQQLQRLTQLGAQCALELEESLNNYTVTEEIKLFLHTGVGTGKVQLVHIGGFDNQAEFLVVGEPISQITDALHYAEKGEVVLSPVSHHFVSDFCQGDVLENGFFRVKEFTSFIPKAPRSYEFPPELCHLLIPYVNGSVYSRFRASYTTSMLNEIRKISVMFVKIPDLTFRNQATADTAQRFFHSAQKILKKEKGFTRQFIMDDKGCVLITCFGLPPASHYDDPFRCVVAAQEIRHMASSLKLKCSIGVTSGTIFCGVVGNQNRWEYALVGDLVNLSARLCNASDDDIICDEKTQKSCVDRELTMKSLGAIKVKGKSILVQIYSANQSRRVSQPSNSMKISKTFFYGRDKEKEIIRNVIDDCTRSKESSIVIIDSEPGMGKTSLLYELHTISQNLIAPCILIESKSQNHTVFGVWKNLICDIKHINLKTLGEILAQSADDISPVRKKSDPKYSETGAGSSTEAINIRRFSVKKKEPSDSPVNVPVKPSTQPNPTNPYLAHSRPEDTILGLSSEKDRSISLSNHGQSNPRMDSDRKIEQSTSAEDRFITLKNLVIESIKNLRKGLSQVLIIYLDDLNDMDDSSVDILSSIVKELPPVVLVCSITAFDSHKMLIKPLLNQGNIQRITLEPLTQETIGLITRQTIAVDGIAPAMEATLAEKSHGNPLILKQLLNAGLAVGFIIIDFESRMARIDNAVIEKVNYDPNDMMSGIVMSTVDRLHPSDQMLLKVSSCVGEVFHRDLLERVLHNIRQLSTFWKTLHERMDQSLTELVSKGLLEIYVKHSTSLKTLHMAFESSSVNPDSEADKVTVYRFSNRTILNIVRGLVTTEHRTIVSTQIVSFSESGTFQDSFISFSDLAEHLIIVGQEEKAMHCYAKAGKEAFSNGAASQSALMFTKALNLADKYNPPLDVYLNWAYVLGNNLRFRGDIILATETYMKGLKRAGAEGFVDLRIFDGVPDHPLSITEKLKLSWKAYTHLSMVPPRDSPVIESQSSKVECEILHILSIMSIASFFSGKYNNHSLLEIAFTVIRLASRHCIQVNICHGLFYAAVAFENLGLEYWGSTYQQEAMTRLNVLDDRNGLFFRVRAIFILSMMKGNFDEAFRAFDFDPLNPDDYGEKIMVSLETALSSITSILFYSSNIVLALQIAQKLEDISRKKETALLEVAAIGIEVLCTYKLGRLQDCREIMSRIDYRNATSDPALRVTFLSTAAGLYFRDGNLIKCMELLQDAYNFMSQQQMGVNMSYIRSYGAYLGVIFDAWQMCISRKPDDAPKSRGFNPMYNQAGRLSYLYDGLIVSSGEDSLAQFAQELEKLYQDGIDRSGKLNQTFRPNRPQHYIFTARAMQLQSTPGFFTRRSVLKLLEKGLAEAQALKMRYEEAEAFKYMALIASSSPLQARTYLVSARNIYQELSCEYDLGVITKALESNQSE